MTLITPRSLFIISLPVSAAARSLDAYAVAGLQLPRAFRFYSARAAVAHNRVATARSVTASRESVWRARASVREQ